VGQSGGGRFDHFIHKGSFIQNDGNYNKKWNNYNCGMINYKKTYVQIYYPINFKVDQLLEALTY
jgi:hypothetical protein